MPAEKINVIERKSKVWLNQSEKIASFHQISNGVPREFLDEKKFRSFIEELMDKGYRFE